MMNPLKSFLIIMYLLAIHGRQSLYCQSNTADGYQRKIIFEDDFKDNSNRWFTKVNSDYNIKIENGVYHIEAPVEKALVIPKNVLINTNYDYEIEIKFRCYGRYGGALPLELGDSLRKISISVMLGVVAINKVYCAANFPVVDGAGTSNVIIIRKTSDSEILSVNGSPVPAYKSFSYYLPLIITRLGIRTIGGILEIQRIQISYLSKAPSQASTNVQPTAHEKTKGSEVESTQNQPPGSILQKGKTYAFIIAEQDYKNDFSPLLHPIGDAKSLAAVLSKNYQFDSIKTLYNPSKSEIMRNLLSYKSLLGENDNFLLFYSGHGSWDSDIQQGYWLPAEADKSDPTTWISNSDIKDRLKSLRCLHTFLVSDACFAGGILRTRDAELGVAPRAITELYNLKSRKAMTSGAMTEVPDESAFMKYFLLSLQNNKEKFISSETLFQSFKENAINNSKMNKLVPQFGVINDTDDQGGDYIFIKK